MKKILSLILSLTMLLSVTAGFSVTAQAASVGTVSGLTVVSKTATTVKLKWKKVKKATGYQVYYSTSKNKNYKKAKSITKGKTVTAKITKLKSNKKYYFKVRAVKGKNKGKFSSVVSAKTKMTAEQAKTFYKKANTVAERWLMIDGGCYYMEEEWWNSDDTLYFEENGIKVSAIRINHKSIDSVAKLKKHLSKYFTKDVYDDIVSYAYRDIDNELYFVANYGIGSYYGYKLKSVSIKSQNNGTVKMNIKINEVEPVYNSKTKKYEDKVNRVLSRNVKLVYKDGKWLFTRPFYIVSFGSEICLNR